MACIQPTGKRELRPCNGVLKLSRTDCKTKCGHYWEWREGGRGPFAHLVVHISSMCGCFACEKINVLTHCLSSSAGWTELVFSQCRENTPIAFIYQPIVREILEAPWRNQRVVVMLHHHGCWKELDNTKQHLKCNNKQIIADDDWN